MTRKYTIPYFGIIVVLAWVIVGFAMVAASAADEDPPNDPPRVRARFVPPLPRIWQCNDIRVTETVLQPGVVNYDLGGTIWGGSQFTLNIQQGDLYFNGRPCYRWR
jgi:hypothetical protein